MIALYLDNLVAGKEWKREARAQPLRIFEHNDAIVEQIVPEAELGAQQGLLEMKKVGFQIRKSVGPQSRIWCCWIALVGKDHTQCLCSGTNCSQELPVSSTVK
jgi:hypothetical protein